MVNSFLQAANWMDLLHILTLKTMTKTEMLQQKQKTTIDTAAPLGRKLLGTLHIVMIQTPY